MYKDYSKEKLTPEQLKEILKTSVMPKKHKLKDLVLLEKNANIMSSEQYKLLVENMKHDGVMTQWPFVMKLPDGKYGVPSGNHRVKAAIEAGITEDWCVTCEVTLPADEARRIQISHNSIRGEQRNIVLLELAEGFEDIELLRLSGAQFDIAKLNIDKLEFQSIDSGGLDLRLVEFYFSDSEISRLDKLLEDLDQKLTYSNNPIYVVDKNKHKKFIDAVTKAKTGANIKSTGTVIGLIFNYISQHREEFIKSLLPEEVKSDTINEE